MVVFEKEGIRFNYRIGGIAIRNGRLLLCYAPEGDFWYLPGGRVEMGEAARESLQREVWEELGLEAKVGPLRWVAENFFTLGKTHFHELGLYFDLDLDLEIGDTDILGKEGNSALLFRWFPLSQLPNIKPDFIKTELHSPLPNLRHIVQDERPD